MSISTRDPINQEAWEYLNKLFGEPVVRDDFTALYDNIKTLDQHRMKEAANIARQPVTVELNDTGDEKIISDNIWTLSKEGWKRSDAKAK